MQRQDLIDAIATPPTLKVSKYLLAPLYPPPVETIRCLNPDCDNTFPAAKVYRKTPNGYKPFDKEFCSRACAGKVQLRKVQPIGCRIASDNRRGTSKRGYIRVRVNGKDTYLHRHIVETQIGVKLSSHELVHHRDRNKTHNCFWKNPCSDCRAAGEPNLEVLIGEDAREHHIRRHQEEMQKGRKRKR